MSTSFDRTPRLIFAVAVVLTCSHPFNLPANAQVPNLYDLTKLKAPEEKSAEKPPIKTTAPAEKRVEPGPSHDAAAPSKNFAEVKVAETSGAISVQKTIPDKNIAKTLEGLLERYPGVRKVGVQVEQGVAAISGQVEDEDVRDNVTDFARKVEGVRLVLNSMKIDAQVMSASELATKVLLQYRDMISRNWILILVALGVLFLFLTAARLFTRYSETLLAPFLSNVILRSVVGSVSSSLLILIGIMLALSILNLTQAVMSILGLAGVVGLALGFAFRDIAENFIASILLGVRRPFQIGDYITVAGHAGVVLLLNTRATVLTTLEGNQVRIPNSVIFKEITVNSSASPSTRGSFDVVIPYVSATSAAVDAVTAALRSQEGILAEPPPRALIEALEPNGVRLRAYYWMPTKGVDGYKVQSDAKLKAKVALMERDITPTPLLATVSVQWPTKKDRSAAPNERGSQERRALSNLKRDSRVADAPQNVENTSTIDHLLNQPVTSVTGEGVNLLESANNTAS